MSRFLRSWWRDPIFGGDKNRRSKKGRRRHFRPSVRPQLEALETRVLLAGSVTPPGNALTPIQIRHAYGIDRTAFQIGQGGPTGADGGNQTIAIVDAYDDPTIFPDLQQFDKQFGLPDPPFFEKVNQDGDPNNLPGTDPSGPGSSTSWEYEESLDVEWAHVVAPYASIILVEANTSGFDSLSFNHGIYGDLAVAIDTARHMPGVSVISMSFGQAEFKNILYSETNFDSLFTTPSGHQPITFVASTGDKGAPGGYPAYSPNVLAVGGTALSVNPNNTWQSEAGWGTVGNLVGSSGGGISLYEGQPAYQNGVVSAYSTTQRTIPDVSFDAGNGVAICDSYDNGAATPWSGIGGTSLAAPCWAGVIALADEGTSMAFGTTLDTSQVETALYQTISRSDFHDITTGTSLGSPNYNAGPGYDLVTGLGTPLVNLLVPDLAGLPAPLTYDVQQDSKIHNIVVRVNPNDFNMEILDNSVVVESKSLSTTTTVTVFGADATTNNVTVDYNFGGFIFYPPVTFNGGANGATNTLTITDSQDAFPHAWDVTSSSSMVTDVGMPYPTVNYDKQVQSVTLDSGKGGGTVQVDSTGVLTDLVTGGKTTVTIGHMGRCQSIIGTLNIESGGMGQNTITVDNSNADAASIFAGLGKLALGNPNDSEGNSDDWGQIFGLAPADINYEYDDTPTLTVYTGTRTNAQVHINDTAANSTTTIVTGPSTFTTLLVTQDGNAQTILGTLNLEGSNIIGITDAADSTARTVTLKTIGDLEGDGDTWGQIHGLASGDINYEYNDTGDITLYTGAGAGTIVNVKATNPDPFVNTNIATFGTTTINVGNAGRIQDIGGTLNLEGTNSITIDDSADPSNLQWFLTTLGINPNDAGMTGDLWGEVDYNGSTEINYEYNDTSSLTLATGGSGPGTGVEVLATNPNDLGCQTNIVSHAPTTVKVGDASISRDVQTIASTLNLENPTSVDTIIVDDSFDNTARTATLSVLEPNPADSEQNFDRYGQISGLAPGAINYEYGDVSTLTIFGSFGGTAYSVSDLPNVNVTLYGVGGTNSLGGPNQSNSWALNAKDSGVLDSNIIFQAYGSFGGFQNLAGGTVGDTFTLTSGVPIAMNLALNSSSTLTTPAGQQTLAGTIQINTGLLTVNGAGNTTITKAINGPGGLIKQDAGTLSLSAANRYSGNTTIESGILIAGADGALGSAGTSTTVQSGSTLDLDTYTISENLYLNGTGVGGIGALGVGTSFAGSIVLQSDSTITMGNSTITGPINNGSFVLTIATLLNSESTIQGAISGSGSLVKQGNAILILSAANSYTGGTSISAGMLIVSADSALGGANSSTTVSTGTTLAFAGGVNYVTSETVYLNGQGGLFFGGLLNMSGANSFAGPITVQSVSTINTFTGSLILGGAININGAFTLTVAGKGNTTFKGVVSGAGGLKLSSNGALTLAASNTYSGNTTIAFGTIVVSADAGLGAAKTTTTVNAGTSLVLAGGFSYLTSETLDLNGTGFNNSGALENLNGNNTWAGPINLQSASTINAAAGTLTLSGPTNTGGNTLTFAGTGNITIPGTIIGAGNLGMQATGALTLSAANSFGSIGIVSGSVWAEADGALGNGALVSAGGVLIFAGLNYTQQTTLILAGGLVEGVNVLGPVNTFAGFVQLMGPATIVATPNTTFTFSSPMFLSSYQLTVVGPGSLLFNGQISGSGGLNLMPATLTLSANNTYTGPTTVNGNLIVNGSQPSSAVTVQTGILAGTGSVGAVVIQSGGIVEPGPLNGGVGTLTASSADFSQGGELLIRIPSLASFDQLNVSGAFTLGGTSTLVIDVQDLTTKGKATGIISFGSVSGTFNTVNVSHNHLSFKVKLKPRANSFDVDIS
jgi:autotransporter-associated beta strand protein